MKKYNADKMPLAQYWYVLELNVKKSIKQQYRNSTLGVIWTVLNPLLNMLVMAFVFSTIFGRGNINMDYACYLLAGNMIFGFMRGATTMSLTCVVENRDLMTKTRVPISTFTMAKTVTALTNFGFSMIALILVMVVQYCRGQAVVFGVSMLLAVLVVPALFMFSLGLGFFLSTIYVRFRDVKHLYSVFLTLWMYATPIFYSLDFIKDDIVKKVIGINPMTIYVDIFRNVFIAGGAMDWMQLLIGFAWGIGMLLIGLLVFHKSKNSFVLHI
ncbi:MAG: ABC transporter permease [Clostridiales bacterium]|nr:ABC transporter permease [Clostridiales bacterium]